MNQSDSANNIPKVYVPNQTEKTIYDFWKNRGYFKPSEKSTKKPFVIIMPPPNVTGELHMGHALTTALQDLMVRWRRMKGHPTLYLPGTDHAGIATQVVVERMLSKKNISRHALGREAFVDEIWKWVRQYGDRIYNQLESLGASCDWERKSFTLDPNPSKAVRTTFVNLYNKGLIYRGERIVTWCPRCSTALSDLEINHKNQDSNLYFIKYKLSTTDDFITIATTRPETILADTGIAVHPEDKRHQHLIGKQVNVPLTKRKITIVADDIVGMEFGTGILKVTPGHDPIDFEIGQRHNLKIINILDTSGLMNSNAQEYKGKSPLTVRSEIVQNLTDLEQIEKIIPYNHSVGHCSRCDDVVEPIISKQWFVKMEPIAKPAIQAVKNKDIRIIPNHFSKIYFNWMSNIKDWCISRQLWWGHRIPVWYCSECDQLTIQITDPTNCHNCNSTSINQDPDVLDTWFSSALWPHSTLGWPENTEDLDKFYPTSVLETGHDILFFWVARMIMMGIENTGTIPFDTVYLHGLVRDTKGLKMSKTKGNVTDPLDIVKEYGSDALRLSLTSGTSAGNDMRLNESRLQSSRNFANKLWNAFRFVNSKIENNTVTYSDDIDKKQTHLEDRWILSRLQNTIENVNNLLETYQIGEAQKQIQDFFWSEYCDWYLEFVKLRKSSAIPTLYHVLVETLKLLHPFAPFITETIWQILSKQIPSDETRNTPLIITEFPTKNSSLIDTKAENDISIIIEIIHTIRNLRSDLQIPHKSSLKANINIGTKNKLIDQEQNVIKSLSGLNVINISREKTNIEKTPNQITLVLSKGTITIQFEQTVNLEKQYKKLGDELIKIDPHINRLVHMIKDKSFINKAPEEVIIKTKDQLKNLENRKIRLNDLIKNITI
tara:strand:+ start:6333 stop:8996 length:2664 start_codon:yes stop_codon:yes gene_type:complete